MGKPWSKEAKRRNRIRRAQKKYNPKKLKAMAIPLDAIPARPEPKAARQPGMEAKLLELCLRQAAIIDMLIQH